MSTWSAPTWPAGGPWTRSHLTFETEAPVIRAVVRVVRTTTGRTLTPNVIVLTTPPPLS
jgi:hypothetical protein